MLSLRCFCAATGKARMWARLAVARPENPTGGRGRDAPATRSPASLSQGLSGSAHAAGSVKVPGHGGGPSESENESSVP